MENEIQIVSDGEGIAVIGEARAVERYLRELGLWGASKNFDLRRLKSYLGLGSGIAQGAAEFSANSGRWIKLTDQSARLVKEHGLMETKTPGVSHLMVGVPGKMKNWLQTEQGVGSLITNPSALSGIAGLMAQASAQQYMAEIVDYLERIDVKVDDVLGKVDDTVLKDMSGARLQVRRAYTKREHEGLVTADSWSEVQNVSGKLADVQGYALLQLERIANKLTSKRMRGLATAATEAEPEVRKWLAVLADCFSLQEGLDVLALDKALNEPADVLNKRRRALEADRDDRLELIGARTAELLTQMDAAVGRANRSLPLTRDKSLTIIDAGNTVATRVHEFEELLGVTAEARGWEPRQLGPVADAGSQIIQKAKDAAPVAGAVLAVGAYVAKRSIGRQ